MTQAKRSPIGRIQVGFGLISFSVVLLVVGMTIAVVFAREVPVRVAIVVFAVALIGVLWVSAVRNGAEERDARRRLRDQHPGSLVERVRLWSLPAGRVEADIPMHFLIADAGEVLFETVDRTALLRIPVDEIGFIDPVIAQGDRVNDKALTIIYGDEQHVVQVFTLTYAGIRGLGLRLRKAIGWPSDGVPVR
ncbi:MAG: hypothetical protein ABL886_08970 [Rhodoglobus sp.]